MKTPEELEQEEYDRQNKMLVELSRLEPFQVWRDTVVKINLEALERDMANSDNLSESVLRGKLKHYQSLKYFFEDVFEIAKSNLKINK